MEGEKNKQNLKDAKIKQFWLVVFILAIFIIGALANEAFAEWNPPNELPPGGNVPPPLNRDTDFTGHGDLAGTYNNGITIKACASPNQVLTWDGAGWVCGSAGGTLLDVLTAGADAHLFPASGNATVSIGDASHAANLSVEGGQISTKWIHATADGVNNIAGSLNVTSNLSALSGISFNPDPNAYRIDVSAANALGFRSPQYFLWAAGVDPTFGNAMMSLWKDGAINKLNVNGELRLSSRAIIPGGVDFNESPQAYKVGVDGTAANALKFAAPVAFLWGFSNYNNLEWTNAPMALYKVDTDSLTQLIVRGQICLPDTNPGNCISNWAEASGYWSTDANNNIYNNNSGGKVAIGTNNPATYAKLLVSMGSSNTNEGIHISRGTSAAYDYSYFNIENESASTVFKVNQTGKVGVGVTDPSYPLQVNANNSSIGAYATNFMGTSVLRFGNSGGNRLFGDAWNISSLITNGGANSSQYQIGDLVFSGRKATTDTTLTEAMRVTAGGNVGIGTASPVSALNVAGTTGLNWAANGTSLGLVTVGTPGTGGSFWINTPASSATYAAGLGVTGSYASLRSTVNINAYGPKFALYGSELAFSTTYGSALNEAMRIDESGNVGIGTNNPGYKLSVQGGNGNNPGISLTSGAANTGTFYGWGKAGASDGGLLGVAGVAENYWTYAAAGDTVLRAASGKLHLATNYNGSGLTLDTSGALLLGTTVLTPDQHGNVSKLLVHTAPNVNIGIGVSTVEPGVAWISAFDDPVLNNLPLRLNSSEFRFYNSDTRLATIQSSGNVGIGISSPSQKLEVNGGIKLNTTIAKPTCNSSTRGTFWFTQGATGTKDSVEVCAKNAAGTYAWRTIY